MVGDVFEYIPDRPGDDTVECRIITGNVRSSPAVGFTRPRLTTLYPVNNCFKIFFTIPQNVVRKFIFLFFS